MMLTTHMPRLALLRWTCAGIGVVSSVHRCYRAEPGPPDHEEDRPRLIWGSFFALCLDVRFPFP
eukprot:scaffold8921_cov137-Isochrysis_galbana.AAC.8